MLAEAETEKAAEVQPGWSVRPIPPDAVAFLWPAFEAYVEDACAASAGRYAPEWVFQAAQAGVVQLWAVLAGTAGRGLVITTLTQYPTGLKVLQVALAAGRGALAAGPAVWAALQAFAQAQGAPRIEWTGRRGWLRVTGGRPIGEAGEADVVA